MQQVQTKQMIYMQSNKINPDTGEVEDLAEERVVEDQLCRESVRKVPKDTDSERAQDGAYGYESNNAQLQQEPIANLKVLTNPLLDLKPYLRGINEWDQRLTRLG